MIPIGSLQPSSNNFPGCNEAVNNTMHQQLPAAAAVTAAASYAGLPHAPTMQQVKDLGHVNPQPQSPINPALMAQTNQQQLQVCNKPPYWV